MASGDNDSSSITLKLRSPCSMIRKLPAMSEPTHGRFEPAEHDATAAANVNQSVSHAFGPLCPLCQAAAARQVLRSRNGYAILSCLNCSLVFTDDRTAPPSDEL